MSALTGLEVRLATPQDMDEIFALRHEVFVIGQDVPADLERDEIDAYSDHAVARLDGVVVGTGRLVPGRVSLDGHLEPAPVATVGRMAVADAARGTGVGGQLLRLLEAKGRDRLVPVVELHAQLHAKGFYEHAGYAVFGEVYLEAGIEHVGMNKHLTGQTAPSEAGGGTSYASTS